MLRVYMIVAIIASFCIAMAGAFFKGKADERREWETKMLQAEVKIKDLEKRAAVINEVIVTKYVDRIQYVDRVKVTTVKEFVTVADDAACTVNKGFVRVHDAAAKAEPITPALTDRLPTETKLSDVSEVVKENYATYNKTKAQLEALQNWVTEQQKNWNK